MTEAIRKKLAQTINIAATGVNLRRAVCRHEWWDSPDPLVVTECCHCGKKARSRADMIAGEYA